MLMTAVQVLCRLEDLEDGQAKGFTLGQGAAARDILVVRADRRVFGYVNCCPHQGLPLDWSPDRFICEETGLILCANHGALFEIEDGTCLAGPCAGDQLQAVPLGLDPDDQVVLEQA